MKLAVTSLALLIIVGLVGCKNGEGDNAAQLQPLNLASKPTIRTLKSAEFPDGKYQTFSVVSSSVIFGKSSLTDSQEKQMLFALRNVLEFIGYTFVSLDENPDFVATVDGSAEYRESYVEPSVITVPRYVPAKTITSNSTSTGNFNYSTWGNYSSYGWGSWTGQITTTTRIPGYVTTETRILPGYTVGAYYPTVTIGIYDGKSRQLVWQGFGAGASKCPNISISGQILLYELIGDFPQYTQGRRLIDSLGVPILVVTLNGKDYFPVVIGKSAKNSPLAPLGLKFGDLITTINGELLDNIPTSTALERILTATEGEFKLTVWRNDKPIELRYKPKK